MSDGKAPSKFNEYVMSYSADTAPSILYNTYASPVTRRRNCGDNVKNVDVGGFWIHIAISSDGIPKETMLIDVNENVSSWSIVGQKEVRSIERLPKTGLYIFLY